MVRHGKLSLLALALLALRWRLPLRPRLAFTLPASLRPPVIVLPGFGNDSGDYIDVEPTVNAGDKLVAGGLVERLGRRGFDSIEVLPVARTDWLRVLGGMFDEDFRAGSAPPDTAFGWYLDKVDDIVLRTSDTHGQQVMLLAHSAGGWLARAALGRRDGALAKHVRALVTLGAPHGRPVADDQTRGALKFVDEAYPGAFFQEEGIEYITVAGAAVIGDDTAERGTPEREAWISYERLVGRGDVAGDGIVPLDNAHLAGATQITLPTARHSIGTPETWYGAEDVIDEWLPQVTVGLAKQEVAGALMGR